MVFTYVVVDRVNKKKEKSKNESSQVNQGSKTEKGTTLTKRGCNDRHPRQERQKEL